MARAVQCGDELAVRRRVPRTPLALVAPPAPRLSRGAGAVSATLGGNRGGHPQGRLRVPQHTAAPAPSYLSAARGDPRVQASVQTRRHGVVVWLSDPVYRPPAGRVVQSPSGGGVLSAGEVRSASGGGGRRPGSRPGAGLPGLRPRDEQPAHGQRGGSLQRTGSGRKTADLRPPASALAEAGHAGGPSEAQEDLRTPKAIPAGCQPRDRQACGGQGATALLRDRPGRPPGHPRQDKGQAAPAGPIAQLGVRTAAAVHCLQGRASRGAGRLRGSSQHESHLPGLWSCGQAEPPLASRIQLSSVRARGAGRRHRGTEHSCLGAWRCADGRVRKGSDKSPSYVEGIIALRIHQDRKSYVFSGGVRRERRRGLASCYVASRRARSSNRKSSVLTFLTTSSSGVAAISPCRNPIMTVAWPAISSLTAAAPKRVASSRSNAVGAPPRWTWPRIVARISYPSPSRL